VSAAWAMYNERIFNKIWMLLPQLHDVGGTATLNSQSDTVEQDDTHIILDIICQNLLRE